MIAALSALPLGAALNVQARSLPSAAEQSVAPAVAQASGETAVLRATAAQRAQAAQAWTPEARRKAEPLAFPQNAVVSPQAAAQPSGPAGSVKGRAPTPDADGLAKQQFPQEWAAATSQDSAAAATAADFGTAGVFTSYRANLYSTMWRDYPYRATGKLYISGGGYCSASVISPNNIIVTAAHCVYDTVNNRWMNGWTFVPADRAGAAPYGTFPWTSARVLNNWINASGTDRRYDVAVITLGNNSTGRPVTFYSGWLGRSWNHGSTQHHHAIGYPSNLSSGLYTNVCAAESFSGGADVLGMGCDMTFGSSGGPWIRAFTPHVSGSVNFANSVVSGGTPGTNTFYGARFSSNNIVPLCTDQGC